MGKITHPWNQAFANPCVKCRARELLLTNQKRSETPCVATVRLVFSYHHAQFGPTISIMTTERKPVITKQFSSVSELILISTPFLNWAADTKLNFEQPKAIQCGWPHKRPREEVNL